MSTQKPVLRELFIPAEPSPWKPWLVGSFAATVILAIALVLMKVAGLLAVPKDDVGTKTLAASLGLIGAVLSAAVTLVGTVVKYSIDDRTARLAAVEAGRNYALAIDAEQRNRIEAAIRAVGLLSENNKDATTPQIGGALLALSSLREHELAVALLSQLWPGDLASAAVAGVVLSRALRDGSAEAQIDAGVVISDNADRIQQESSNIWPIPVARWRMDLPENARLGMILAAAGWVHSVLSHNRTNFGDGVIVLYRALDDPDHIVRDIPASVLRPISRALPADRVIYLDEAQVTFRARTGRWARLAQESSSNYGRQWESAIQQLFATQAQPAHRSPEGEESGAAD